MKKILCMAACAAAAVAMTGCQMCIDPQDASCVEASHPTNKMVTPDGLSAVAPVVLEAQDAYVPQFKAGKPVDGFNGEYIGAGKSIEEATNDAIMKFKKANKCDYVVVVNLDIEQKSHPSYRLFKTSNYSVMITRGIPVYLDSLKSVAKPVSAAEAAVSAISGAAASVVAAPAAPAASCQNSGLIKLSDINVQITAKGESKDNAAVIYPVK